MSLVQYSISRQTFHSAHWEAEGETENVSFLRNSLFLKLTYFASEVAVRFRIFSGTNVIIETILARYTHLEVGDQ